MVFADVTESDGVVGVGVLVVLEKLVLVLVLTWVLMVCVMIPTVVQLPRWCRL